MVDDERHIADFLSMGLEGRGMEVRCAADGLRALEVLDEFRPDVVVLDLILPGISGIEVCKKLRGWSGVPVLILSARDEVGDRVEGLNSGADDYLIKPFAFEELAARVVALLRRSGAPPGRTLNHAGLTMDLSTREVTREGRRIELTAREFDLLRLLMEHPRQVLSKVQIMESVWGYDYLGNSNVVEAYISYLRRKLDVPGEAGIIETVRGAGYRMRG